MTRTLTILFSSMVLVFSSLAAYSGSEEDMQTQTQSDSQVQPNSMQQAKSFTEVDTDRSGTLDKTEAAAAEIEEQQFTEADKDTNGELDRKEYYAVVTQRQ